MFQGILCRNKPPLRQKTKYELCSVELYLGFVNSEIKKRKSFLLLKSRSVQPFIVQNTKARCPCECSLYVTYCLVYFVHGCAENRQKSLLVLDKLVSCHFLLMTAWSRFLLMVAFLPERQFLPTAVFPCGRFLRNRERRGQCHLAN